MLVAEADDREGCMELGLCCQLPSADTCQESQLDVAPALTVQTLERGTRLLRMASTQGRCMSISSCQAQHKLYRPMLHISEPHLLQRADASRLILHDAMVSDAVTHLLRLLRAGLPIACMLPLSCTSCVCCCVDAGLYYLNQGLLPRKHLLKNWLPRWCRSTCSHLMTTAHSPICRLLSSHAWQCDCS